VWSRLSHRKSPIRKRTVDLHISLRLELLDLLVGSDDCMSASPTEVLPMFTGGAPEIGNVLADIICQSPGIVGAAIR
jgi:hypothetical protein